MRTVSVTVSESTIGVKTTVTRSTDGLRVRVILAGGEVLMEGFFHVDSDIDNFQNAVNEACNGFAAAMGGDA